MKSSKRLWRILELVNFALDVFILFFLIAGQWVVAPTFLQVLGRAHPMILHFPIVFIILFPIIPWVLSTLSIPKDSEMQYMRRYIRIAHFFCAVTVFFGLILSLESGYSGPEVNFHKWGGVLLLLTIIVLENTRFWHPPRLKYPWAVLAIPGVALVITSHIGSGITHGSDFLTEPISKKTTQHVPLDQAKVFRDVIHPILDQKCMNCHNTSKSKGELILEDSASILRGGEGGAVLVFENPSESPLFQRLILDIDHEDHMPPKGKPQLTQQEILLIREWIGHEKLFEVAYTGLDPSDSLTVLIKENYDAEAPQIYDMKPAREADIQALNDNYRMLSPVARESPALYARFLSASHFEKDHLQALTKTRKQIVDLYLGHMPVDDEDLQIIESFENLQVLNLNGTGITDQGLPHLYKLDELQKLYLTGTDVTDEGIRRLLEANPIKKLYVWNTTMDSTSIKNLGQEFPETAIIGETNPFGNEVIALNAPQIKPESSFFKSSLTVNIDHPIPGVIIRYTTDGSEPDSLNSLRYEGPMEIGEDTRLNVQVFKPGWISSPVVEKSYFATQHPPDSVWFITDPNPRFAGDGPSTVVNLQAGDRVHEDKNYLAYRENNSVMGFSFEEPINLKKIIVSGLIKTPSYIFPPLSATVEAWNGETWVKVVTHNPDQPAEQVDFQKYYLSMVVEDEVHTDKLRISVNPLPRLPQWHPGQGDKAWVFIDEVLFQ